MQFVQLHMTRERPSEWDIPINSPAEVHRALIRLIGNLDAENCVVLTLDSKGRVNHFYNVGRGTLNSTYMHPREVFKTAILSNASSIIVAHNHPSGDLTPSAQDLDVTRVLVKAGQLLGIPVNDHVIVSDTAYYSLREHKKIKFGKARTQ